MVIVEAVKLRKHIVADNSTALKPPDRGHGRDWAPPGRVVSYQPLSSDRSSLVCVGRVGWVEQGRPWASFRPKAALLTDNRTD